MSGATIALRDVVAYGRHGADSGERDAAQALRLDVELELDDVPARRSDALTDTLDYAALHARIVALVRDTSFALLERLGEAVLDEVMRDRRVAFAKVTLAKPQRLHGATAAVTVARERAR